MKNYDTIPNELKELDQWVCAKSDSKAPQKAFEWGSASSTDKSTWSYFEQAEWAVNEGHYDYIGFVFNDNGYVGIDIDTGYDEDGFISLNAAKIISHCKSYTEKSKSGRGMHIIIKGDLPFKGKNNRDGIEIYKDARYFVTTGDVLIYKDIVENQEAIDWVVSNYFTDSEQISLNSPFNKQDKFYNPVWSGIEGNKIQLRPTYKTIKEGSRNLSLLSLAGSLRTQGYTKEQIYKELQFANQEACKPPLKDNELQSICNSIMKYRRD